MLELVCMCWLAMGGASPQRHCSREGIAPVKSTAWRIGIWLARPGLVDLGLHRNLDFECVRIGCRLAASVCLHVGSSGSGQRLRVWEPMDRERAQKDALTSLHLQQPRPDTLFSGGRALGVVQRAALLPTWCVLCSELGRGFRVWWAFAGLPFRQQRLLQ